MIQVYSFTVLKHFFITINFENVINSDIHCKRENTKYSAK